MEQSIIARDLAIAIYNDDFSGLSDKEIDKIETYMIDNKISHIIPTEDYVFERCEVTGLYADCIYCNIIIRE